MAENKGCTSVHLRCLSGTHKLRAEEVGDREADRGCSASSSALAEARAGGDVVLHSSWSNCRGEGLYDAVQLCRDA